MAGKRPTYGTYRRVRLDGYVDIWSPAHPLARADGYVFEHRVVLADAGIVVPDGFQVHHINEDRADNRIDNLAVVTSKGHNAIHAVEGSLVRNQHGTAVVGEGITRRARQRKEALGPRCCDQCSTDITDRRIDARFCGTACRNAHHSRGSA